jgi:N6-L-threonylcarbamoyladenine synthase
MNILAIETSCDETAAAVVKDGRILSNIVASQAKDHIRYGGIVPEVAARKHIPAIIPTINKALEQANISPKKINVIAVTQGPGLMTSLLVGIDTAKALAIAWDKPLLPINHMEAHIYANFAGRNQESRIRNQGIFPALVLIVSGGHTLLVLMNGHGRYQVVGETLDDAAGEAFDKSARLMGFGYPGGPQISKFAKLGDPKKYNFPRPMLKHEGLDFSFSGLKTAVLYEFAKHKKTKQLVADMSASLQAAIIESLIGKTEQAINKYRPKILMLGGGVAANEMLREEIKKLAKKYKLKNSIPQLEYCTDNAGMIGLAAYYKIKSRKARFAARFDAQANLAL